MNENKRILITGGSRGIGRAAVELFAARGWNVAYTYNNTPPSGAGRGFKCDVRSFEECVKFVQDALETLGGVDALVCCAGVARAGLFQKTSDEEFSLMFDVNMRGVFNVCKALAPHFINEKSGVIITVASMWGLCGASCEAVYSASKAAVVGFTKSLAKELAPSGVRVNCLAPGAVQTDMLSSLSENDLVILRDETPLGRLAAPEEMARYLLFLASGEASFMTGQVLSPNGGMVI